jgi:hypothetical protein
MPFAISPTPTQPRTPSFGTTRWAARGRTRSGSEWRAHISNTVHLCTGPRGTHTASVTVSDDGHFQNAEFSLYDQRGHLWEQLWVKISSATYKSLFDVWGHRIYSAYFRKGALLNELRHKYDVLGKIPMSVRPSLQQ